MIFITFLLSVFSLLLVFLYFPYVPVLSVYLAVWLLCQHIIIIIIIIITAIYLDFARLFQIENSHN